MDYMNLYLKEDKNIMQKKCWYCDLICYTFVSICDDCKKEKLLFKKKEYYKQNECK